MQAVSAFLLVLWTAHRLAKDMLVLLLKSSRFKCIYRLGPNTYNSDLGMCECLPSPPVDFVCDSDCRNRYLVIYCNSSFNFCFLYDHYPYCCYLQLSLSGYGGGSTSLQLVDSNTHQVLFVYFQLTNLMHQINTADTSSLSELYGDTNCLLSSGCTLKTIIASGTSHKVDKYLF
jgi:hypothetical protein